MRVDHGHEAEGFAGGESKLHDDVSPVAAILAQMYSNSKGWSGDMKAGSLSARMPVGCVRRKYNAQMLKLFRETDSPQADTIDAEFRDMVLGFERVIMEPPQALEKFGPEHSLPVLTNGDRVVSGEAIPAYIKELKQLIHDWQAYQGDSCYVDEDGNICFN
jgi:hypothetical protein